MTTRTIRERLRWRVALLLNRSRRLCWSELGSWAVYGGEIRERRWDASWCRDNDLCNGRCYCGKIDQRAGRF